MLFLNLNKKYYKIFYKYKYKYKMLSHDIHTIFFIKFKDFLF